MNILDVPLSAWIVATSMAVLGGATNFYEKIRSREVAPSFVSFMGEILISAFCGMLAFLYARSSALDVYMTAAIAGVAGHMGSRTLFLLERIISRKLGIDR